MKNYFYVIFCLFCFSCSNETDLTVKDKKADFIRSQNENYITGKLTTVYESGKTLVTDLPIQSIKPSPFINLKNNSQSSVKLLNEKYDIYTTSTDVVLPDADESDTNISGIPILATIYCQFAKDRVTGEIVQIIGFTSMIPNPSVYYTASNGQAAYRTTEVIDLFGSGSPIPGLPVLIEWQYYVKCVYTYNDGTRFTRVYPRSGMKLQS